MRQSIRTHGQNMDISPSKMREYREGWRRRQAEERAAQERLRARAWAVAHRGAVLLRERFGARRVVLFGSLARGDPLDAHSDVDLAAWGIDERAYLRAISQLLDLDPVIPVDLVRAEEASPSFLEEIEREGVEL